MSITVITIGRESGNDIVIQNDPFVGRTHCQLVKDESGDYWVIDLNSKNGTFVNGVKQYGKTRLKSHDVVRIGNTTLPWQSYFPPIKETSTEYNTRIENDINSSTSEKENGISVAIFVAGLLSIGIIAYIIINYLTSIGHGLATAFGGKVAALKLFPIYLRGYFGVGGQWFPMIAAVVLGLVADFIDAVGDARDNKLASAGVWLGNAGVSIGGIFILLAIFAEKIVMI